MTDDLRELAREAWLADDPDPASRDELRAAARRACPAPPPSCADRFAGPLTFGTAGLRGPLRAGPNGMNLAVVTQAAAGLVGWLAGPGRERSAGHRVRRPARLAGVRRARPPGSPPAPDAQALLLPRPLPTPVLAYAVRRSARWPA